MKHTRTAALALAILLVGCGGGKDKHTETPDKTDGTDGSGPGEGTGDGSTVAATDTEPAIPTEGDPEDHYLGHGDLFASVQGYGQGTIYVEAVIELSPPDGTGKGTFKQVRNGKQLVTEHFWKTRKAAKDDLKVGMLAMMTEQKDGQGIYVPPTTVQQAYNNRWWVARIVSVMPLESKGYVWVAGGYKVNADAIRVLVGDDSATVVLEGEEDAHFVRSDHWFTGVQPIPATGYIYVNIAAALTPMEGGEGRFVSLNNGLVHDTAHAWKSKIAKPKDVKVGTHVLIPDFKQGTVYSAPVTRKDALFSRWWIVKVEKKNKDTVMVEGGYEVAMDACRILE